MLCYAIEVQTCKGSPLKMLSICLVILILPTAIKFAQVNGEVSALRNKLFWYRTRRNFRGFTISWINEERDFLIFVGSNFRA